MSSNWVTMYDVQLRYRNAAFAHTALRLLDEFGTSWFEEQVRPLFTSKEWLDLDIADLLRFVLTIDFDRAIYQSKQSGGEEPRSYALKREFEEIRSDAKKVLMAASRAGPPGKRP